MIIAMILLALSLGISLLGLCLKKVDYKIFIIGSLILCCLSMIFTMQVITLFIEKNDWVALMDVAPVEQVAIFIFGLCLFTNTILFGVSKYRVCKKRDSK